MRWVIVALSVLLLVGCSDPAPRTTLISTTVPTATRSGDGYFDLVGDPSSTIAAPRTTTTTVPLVPSPFTDGEIDFLNAMVGTGFHTWLNVGRRTRFSHSGVDLDGDGRPNWGWDNLNRLETYLNIIENSYFLCEYDEQEEWVREVADDARLEREKYVIVVRAWLC